MQFHPKAQEQALMSLQVQHEIAVASIKDNEQLTEEEKQTALKEELNNYKQKKKVYKILHFNLSSFSIIFFLFLSKKTIIFAPSQRGAVRLRSYPLNLGR